MLGASYFSYIQFLAQEAKIKPAMFLPSSFSSPSLINSQSATWRRRTLASSLEIELLTNRLVENEMAGLETRISFESMVIKPPSHPTYDLTAIIKLALSEDVGDQGDVTCLATIPDDKEAEAHFLAKEDGIIAGIALAKMVFNEVDPSLKVEWSQKDGDYVHKGLKFGKVHGRAHNIVRAERVVLNFMQRMSGIATQTKAMADAPHPALILETRKTAPSLRLVDKWAVLIGGGRNHRMGLFDMVLIKDNHISIVGGVTNALKSVDSLEKRNL